MMAAIAAADSGADVCLIEKNEKLGKKLFLTGKGRCNVTNAGDRETLFQNVVKNGKFLYSAFHAFDNRAVMEWFEQAGCPLKVERGDRVFPVSDHSSDVIAALDRELRKRGVEILLRTQASSLGMEEMPPGEKAGKRVTGATLKDGRFLEADRVIVCTGGLSYPSTGSTGDGYRFAREAGLAVQDCRPSLVPFEVEESWCRELMGLSLRNVQIRLTDGGKERYQGFGELLFTHFGVSGPLALSASAWGVNGRLFIDLKPALTLEQLDKRLLREFEENANRQFKNALGGLFPAKLIPVMVRLSGIDPDSRVHDVPRRARREFGALIKGLPLTVTGTRGYEEAVITRGGVSVKECNPSTMEAKRVKGLFFAGEVLDLDALTGGFNLQIAWSTGYAAGKGEKFL